MLDLALITALLATTAAGSALLGGAVVGGLVLAVIRPRAALGLAVLAWLAWSAATFPGAPL